MNISRRSFVALCAAASAGCMLAGCEAGKESDPAGRAFNPESFVIPPALGDTYQEAKAAARKLADDAVLMGIRPTRVTAAGETVSWDYLFASHRELSYYIVFTRSGATAARLGECTLLNTEWKALPDAESTAIDANAAYRAVCAAATNAPAAENVYVYLSTYFRNFDTDAEMYEYRAEPMKWYFEFNVESESSLPSGIGEAEDNLSAGGEDAVSSEAESKRPPMFVYSVDALTGEVSVVLG